MKIPSYSVPDDIRLGIYGISSRRLQIEKISRKGQQIVLDDTVLVDRQKKPLVLDAHSFRCLTYGFFADKHRLYGMTYTQSSRSEKFFFTPIKGADIATLEGINMYYAKDKKRCYFAEGGKVIKEKTLLPLRAYVNNYQRENYPELEKTYTWMSTIAIGEQGVYHRGKKLKEADPKTFCQIGSAYYKDQCHVYQKNGLRLKKLEGVDTASFIELSDRAPAYATDKNRPIQCLYDNSEPNQWFNFYRKDFERLRSQIADDYWWYQLEKSTSEKNT